MGKELFELAILISLKDAASGQLGRFEEKLRATGKEGRATLKMFQDLRKDMHQGLVMGGIGVAGLMMLRGGIKSAGDFEAAMADLRMSIEETGSDGKINLSKLGDELNGFEKLGMNLGNRLPGTTQDFIEMFSTLKQGGLSAKTILDGTGEAVANLAVVTGQVPKALAEPFAQYVQQFKLMGGEATQLADIFAKLKFGTGLNPEELIQGSKFFQLRAGAPLGMTGLQGADTSGRLMGLFRKSGLEGGIAGREVSGMFGKLTFDSKPQQKALAELRQHYGITLQFFDKKGKFLGIDNVFTQMEKLKKLGQEQRISIVKNMFGEEAVGPATVMIEAGLAGWKKFNAEVDKGSSLQDKINEKVGTYNSKMEAVLGTVENLKATTFTPMLDTLKPVLDTSNSIAGSMQGWMKEHQSTASLATYFWGVASATLAIAGGLKAATAAYGMWKIAQAFGGGQNPFAPGYVAPTSNWRQSGMRMGKYLMGGFAAAGALYLLDKVLEGRAATAAAEGRAFEAGERLGQMISDGMRQEIEGKLSDAAIAELRKVRAWQEAPARVESLGITHTPDEAGFFGDQSKFNKALGDIAKHGVNWNASTIMSLLAFGAGGGQKAMQEIDPNRAKSEDYVRAKLQTMFLHYPEQLKAFLDEAKKPYQRSGDQKELDKFVELKRLAGETYPKLMAEIEKTDGSMSGLTRGADAAAFALLRVASSTPGFPGKVLPIFPGQGRSPLPGFQQKPGSFNIDLLRPNYQARAMGGDVKSEGLVHIHEGERILKAADVTRGYKGGGGGGVTITGGIHIHAAKGSKLAEDPDAFMAEVLEHVTHAVRKQRERR